MNKRAAAAMKFIKTAEGGLTGPLIRAGGDIIAGNISTILSGAALLALAGGYVFAKSTARDKRSETTQQKLYQDARLTTDIENVKTKLRDEYESRKASEKEGAGRRSMMLL